MSRWSVALLAAALGACRSSPPTAPPAGGPTQDDRSATIAALEAAQRLWQGLPKKSDYEFVFEWRCFCAYTGPVRIAVAGGEIASIVHADTGEPVPRAEWRMYRTIDGLFALMHQAVARGALGIQARYDPQLGYPTEAFIDWTEAVDEETGFAARGLRLSVR